MIKKLPIIIVIFLVFLFLQKADCQHFERNWTPVDRAGVSQVMADKQNGGWLAIVGGGTTGYYLEKYNRSGVIEWTYSAEEFNFYQNIGFNLHPLSNGNYLVIVNGFECDICLPSAVILLDPNGQKLVSEVITSSDSDECPWLGQIVETSDSTFWALGEFDIWEFNYNDLEGVPFDWEDLGYQRNPQGIWVGKTGLIYMPTFDGGIAVFNQDKVKVDSFPIGNGFDYGVAMTDSTHLVKRSGWLEIIDNQGNVLHNWQIPAGQYLTWVEFVENKILFLGSYFSFGPTTFNRFDLDLTNHEFFEWGDRLYLTSDFAIQHSLVLVGGSEFAHGANHYFTPFLKTFNLDDFSTSDFQKEIELESVLIDSLTGEIKGEFVDPNNTIWVNTAKWKFHNVNILIKNNGKETINEVTINWERQQMDCRDRGVRRTVPVNLLSGQDTLFSLGDFSSSILGTQLPDSLELCIWLTAPDQLLDADNTNDFACETFQLKDRTASNKLIYYNNDFKIYPNPTSNFLNIEFENVQLTNFQLQIIDPFGRTVLSDNNEKGVILKDLNISHLAKGIYFLILKNEEGSVVRKWVKE